LNVSHSDDFLLAHLAIEAADHLRHDGSWFTGEPQRHHFPAGERSTYSAAAVTLAEAALAGRGPLVPCWLSGR